MKVLLNCLLLIMMLGTNTFAQINLNNGLLGYWPLNGNGNDFSPNGLNGTVSATGAYRTADRTGIIGRAMFFNGTLEAGQIDMGTSALNNLATVTFASWVRQDVYSATDQSIFGQDNVLEIVSRNGPNRVRIFNSSGGTRDVNNNVPVGEWYHLVVSCNSTGMTVYINGTVAGTFTGNYSLGTSAFPLRMGGNVASQTGGHLAGAMDEARLYNRLLTADEIAYLSSSISLTLDISTLSSTNYCTGDNISIPFTKLGNGLGVGNIFTAQLSDENGSFADPVNLGILVDTVAGNITGNIPTNIVSGTGYKLRIVASVPLYVGTVSTFSLTIRNPTEGQSTLSRGRILYYPFNANANDSSGNAQNGTLAGGTSFVNDRFGNPQRALQLNGSNGHVLVPSGQWFEEQFTVGVWLNPQAYASWSRIFDFSNTNNNDNILFAVSNLTSGNLACQIRQGTTVLATAIGGTATLNQWSHVAMVYDGTSQLIYLNGNVVASVSSGAARQLTRTINYIGRSPFTNDAYANAAFDDFMIWNRALTPSELRVLAEDGLIVSNSPVCSGGALELNAPIMPNATYSWSGPNGFTSSLRSPVIANVSALNAGNYSLTITTPGCTPATQTKAITIINPTTQPTVSFTGLPAATNIGAATNTLTGTPAGGTFTGNGIVSNIFNPALAGIGTHIIVYTVVGSGGCATTALDTVTVSNAYNMSNNTITACSGGFYDSGGGSANYNNNEDFTTTFCSDNGQRLQFTFTAMSIGTGDTLWAYDGNSTSGPLVAYYCNFSNTDVIWSSGTCITFRFKSNASATTTGWIANFTCLANPVIPNQAVNLAFGLKATCDAIVRDPAGTGNYGYGYAEEVLRSADSTRLRLDFTVFNINFNNGGHWLRIYDGPSTAWPLIGQYNSCCAPPTIIESSGQYLTLVFDANNTNAGVGTRQGFEATVTCFGDIVRDYQIDEPDTVTTCSGIFYDSGNGNNDYSANENYSKTFCADTGTYIQIEFNLNNTAFGSADTLFAYDGSDTTGQLLGVYVTGSRIETLTSAGRCITFKFKSNATTFGRGWQGAIRCVNSITASTNYLLSSGVRYTCGGEIFDPSGGSNYGYGYNIMTFGSYNNTRLRLDFSAFDINFNNGGHWLRIYDGPSNAYPLIGQYNSCCTPPNILESSGRFLTIEFDANNTNAGVGARQGFQATLSCFGQILPIYPMVPGTITACEGVFYDNAGPAVNFGQNQSQVKTFCSGNGLPLRFDFNNNETGFDAGDTLWAFDGPDVNSPQLGTYIQGSAIEPLVSSGSCITFRFVSNTTTQRGWQGFLSCTSTPPSITTYVMTSGTRNVCSGKFLDPGGTGNYAVGSGQTYVQTFTSYSGQQIRAAYNFFNVNGNNGGHWLDVYDGPTTSSTLIGSYNNFNFPPAAFQSTGSSLTFRFRATNVNAGANAGFDFTISCFTGSPIDVGVLNSPICQGSTLQVPFTLNDTVFANNTYTAQLSDSNGNFAGAVTIGSLFTSDSVGTITATIPLNTLTGSGYRIRVNSNQPVQLGSENPNALTIITTPIAPTNIAISGPNIFCNGAGSAALSVANQLGVNYRWILNDTVTVGGNSNTYTATQSGTYKVELFNGCDTVTVVNPRVITTVSPIIAPTITAGGPVDFCIGGSVALNIPIQTGVTYQWKRGTTNVGSNTNTYTATVAGTYTVELTNACGTVVSVNTITVTITGSAPTTPSISAGGPTTFCTGGSVTLTTPSQASVNYQWKLGTTNVGTSTNSFTATTAGTYTLVVSNGCGTFTSSNSITVTVNNLPTVPTISAGGPTSFCSGDDADLSIPTQASVTYQWKRGTTNVGTNANTYTASVAGTYTVELTNTCGTIVSSNNITITITGTAPTMPTITAGGPTSFCSGDDVVLSIPTQSGVTYQWKRGATNIGTNTNTFTANTAGTYTVEVSNSCGTFVSSNIITVTISGAAPTVPSISANGPISFCSGDDVELSVPSQAGVTYQWKRGTTNVGSNSNAYTASVAGTYTVELTNSCGTVVSSNSITITISGTAPITPTITAGGPNTFCTGGSVLLSIATQTGVIYQWKRGTTNVGTSTNTFTANTAGTYTVEVSNSCGTFASSNSITVTVNSLPTVPTITAGGPVSFCTGEDVTLSVPTQSGVSYLWKRGTTDVGSNANTYIANTAGDYTVEVTNSCGTVVSSNTITVTITGSTPITPVIVANGPVSFCAGDDVVLSITGQSGVTYQWRRGTTNVGTNTNTFTADVAGTYTVAVSNSCGTFASSNSITVTISGAAPTVPSISVNGPISFCTGDDVDLSVPAQAGVTYQWKRGTTNVGTNSNTYTASVAGTYTIELTNSCGTVVSSNGITTAISGTAPTTPTITAGGPTSFCSGGTVTLSTAIQTGVTYQWKRGTTNVGASTNTYIADVAGVYTVEVSNTCGSVSSNSITIAVNGSTNGTIAETVCFGDSYTFNNQTLTQSGSYQDTLINTAGCDSILTLNLTVSPRINTTFSEVLCDGSSLIFNGQTISAAGQYLDTLTNVAGCDSFITLNVSLALTSSSTLVDVACESFIFAGQTLTTSGTYTNTLTNSAGCDSVITLQLTILQPTVSALSDTICDGETYTFGGQALSTGGTYTNTVTNAAGCDSVITLELSVRPAPTVTITQAGANLAADGGFATYQWQLNGSDIATATNETYTATQNGNYTVVVTDGNGCEGTAASITVTGVGITTLASNISVELYPNPANDFIIVESTTTITGYEIRNVIGQLVLNGEYNGSINIQDLASATYLVVIKTAKGTAVRKFFKE